MAYMKKTNVAYDETKGKKKHLILLRTQNIFGAN